MAQSLRTSRLAHPGFRLPRLAAALLLPLAAAGCAAERGGPAPSATAPPGFSADTFTRAGLISGATATEAGCRALPDGLWVDTGRRQECIRYAAAGLDRPAQTALVYIPGDPGGVSYRFAAGRLYVDQVSEHYQLSPETRRYGVEALSGAMQGLPVINLARPGMHGSSGDHAEDRQTEDEVELLNGALTQLRQRYGLQDFAVSGFSSGGTILANLLALRTDIRCAVIASAPLDLAEYYRSTPGGMGADSYALRGDLADPMRAIPAKRIDTPIFVIGDHRDRNVPASAWGRWVAAARRAGMHVDVAEITGYERRELGGGPSFHHTSSRGMEVAYACATGWPAEQIMQALAKDQPLIVPRGRHLTGEEIREAFTGRRLRATEWFPRVNVYAFWDRGGRLYHLDLNRPQRRIAELRWWVEGDRLCTSRRGCGEVLEDGRFLHVVHGSPPRLSATFVAGQAGS
jgi:predicted esterase